MPGWRAPELVGREELHVELRSNLSKLMPGRRVGVCITGPRGSGTSALASRLVCTAKDQMTRPGSSGAPLVLRADSSTCRSANSVVAALFREIQADLDSRGASTEFLAMLLARRVRTLGRPTIVWLDQVRATSFELERALRPLLFPEQALPEGPEGLPTLLVVVSGERDPVPEPTEGFATTVSRLSVPPLVGHQLFQAIMARATKAFTAPPSMEAVVAIADLVLAQGWGLSMVGELLLEAGKRAEARGGRWLEAEDVALPSMLPKARKRAAGFDAVLLEVLRSAKGELSVGVLRAQAAERCRATGIRSPTGALLWRHLVGLEKSGVVSREVRVGGSGGSRTMISLAGRP